MHGLCVIRLIRVIGGDVGERGGSGNRIGTTGPRTETGDRWEDLLNGPPRRARGKLSKRITRIGRGQIPAHWEPMSDDFGCTGQVLTILTNTEYTDQY